VVKSFFGSFSNREITLLAAIVSALIAAAVSALTTRYTIKHGPSYKEQIDGLRETIGSLARTQEEHRKQQAEQARLDSERYEAQEKKAEAQRRKPAAKIASRAEGFGQVNYLQLTSSVKFALIEASLLTLSGGKIDDYHTEGSKVTSTGFSLQLTHSSLAEFTNISESYFQRMTFEGSIRFKVLRDALETEGTVPFHAEMVTIGNGLFPKLSG
jgi:hypothetical protein